MEYRKPSHGDEQISIIGLGTSSIQAASEKEMEETLLLDKLAVMAGACVKCGHCQSRCPFHVKQEARLADIAQYFQA